jgi:hypothetical protein
VFENKVLRRIFGPKRDEVTGEWTKLHNDELHDLYSSPSIIRIIKARMSWVGHVTRMGEKRNAYRLLVGKPEGRRPLRRPRRRWLDNIRMDLIEVGWGDVDWIGLAEDRDRWRALVNSVLNFGFHRQTHTRSFDTTLTAKKTTGPKIPLLLNLCVCIPLRVLDPVQGFPSNATLFQ